MGQERLCGRTRGDLPYTFFAGGGRMPTQHYRNGFWIETSPPNRCWPVPPGDAIDIAQGIELWGIDPAGAGPPMSRERSLSFCCYRTTGDDRVFWPAEEWDAFFWRGCNLGSALMDAHPTLGADPFESKYHAVMALVSVKARHTRPYLSANFQWTNDLRVRGDERGVLPTHLGAPPEPMTTDWTVNGLVEYGRSLWDACGRTDHPGECIAAALDGVARMHPAPLPAGADDRLRAVRRALFADPPPAFADGIPDELLADLQMAFFEVYHGRVNRKPDESVGDFLVWAGTGRNDNMRKLVFGQLQRAGSWSVLEREVGIEEMWWRSVRYAGAALSHAAAYWLSEAAPCGGLTPREEALFKLMYCCGPACGGPPLAVLHDRFPLLAPWLGDLFRAPDHPRLDVLHTLLGYYAEMARRRRAADGAGPAPSGGCDVAEFATGRADRTAEGIDARDALAAVAARVAGARGFRCRCAVARWECGNDRGDGTILVRAAPRASGPPTRCRSPSCDRS